MAENRRELQLLFTIKNKAGAALKGIKSQFGSLEKSALRLGASFVAFNTLSSQLSDAFVKAAEFDKAMRRVNTITRLTEEQFKKMGKELLSLSERFPFTAKELADGLFDVASAGVEAENQLAFLEQASKFATAGATDLATSIKGLTAVTKGWGLEAADSVRVADLFFKANELGQTTVQEMASSIQAVTAQAKLSGLSLEELFNVYATFTGVTGNAAEVTTQLKGALNALAAPTKMARAEFDRLGIEVGKAAIEEKGFAQVAKDVFDAVGGDIEQLRKLIPEIRGSQLVAALATEQFDDWNDKIVNIESSAGSMELALTEMQKSTSNQLQLMRNQFDATKIVVGDTFGGIALTMAKFANQMARTTKFIKESFTEGFKFIADVVTRLFEGLILAHTKVFNTLIRIANKGFEKMGLEKRFDEIAIAGNSFGDIFAGIGTKIDSSFSKIGASAKFAGGSSEEVANKFVEQKKKAKELDERLKDLIDTGKKVGTGSSDTAEDVDKLGDTFLKLEQDSRDALTSMKAEHDKNLASIRENIEKTKKAVEELNAEFAAGEADDRKSIAEDIVATEQKVADIKKELQEDVSDSRRAELQTELAREQAALTANAEFIKGMEVEVEEAKRRASLTGLERAIEDFNIKRDLEQKAFNSKLENLNKELKAFKDKEKKEIEIFRQKEAVLEELRKRSFEIHKKAKQAEFDVTKKAIQAEIDLLQQLANASARVRGGKAVNLGGISAAVGGAKSNINTINLEITGNNISSEGDADRLAVKVTDQIMNALRVNQRLAI